MRKYRPLLLAIPAALLALGFFGYNWKELTFLSLVVLAVLLAVMGKGRFSPALLAMTVFALVCGLSGLGADSGKFFLKEYCKVLASLTAFAAVTFLPRGRSSRPVALVLTGAIALFGVLSVDLASSRLLYRLFYAVTQRNELFVGFEEGVRLVGVLGNANVLASLMALGCFLALYLMDSHRTWASVCLWVCGYVFVLCFSIGATAILALASAIYLLLEREHRLLRLADMVLAAAGGAVLAAMTFADTSLAPIALLAAASLGFALGRGLPRGVNMAPKAANRLCLSLAIAVVAFAAAALTLTGPYTYSNTGTLSRSAYLEPGEHHISLEADGPVGLLVTSQSRGQLATAQDTLVAIGWPKADGMTITVPEDSAVTHLELLAAKGRTVTSLTIDGEEVPLKYRLLPEHMAHRLQSLFASQNAAQRLVFWQDGLKLFRESPLRGLGMGCFESSACRVQSYYYETKYVHSQYIQVLADCGILGMAAYLALLGLTALALWKKRKSSQFPAFAACYLMIVLHSAMEVTMSLTPYMLAAYALLALMNKDALPCLKALPERGIRAITALASAAFMVLLGLNIYAGRLTRDPEMGYFALMASLDKAAELDVFEGNDYKVSYVWNSTEYEIDVIEHQAEEYAAQLTPVRSNSITGYLVQYHLENGEYDLALELARFGCRNNQSNEAVWNEYIGYIRQYLPRERLTSAQSEALAALAEDYLQACRNLWISPELTAENQEYLLVNR